METSLLPRDENGNIKPSIELLNVAKAKAPLLQKGQQIWLTATEHSYILFRLSDGKLYIGRDKDSPLKPFFKTAEVIELTAGGYTYLIQKA